MENCVRNSLCACVCVISVYIQSWVKLAFVLFLFVQDYWFVYVWFGKVLRNIWRHASPLMVYPTPPLSHSSALGFNRWATGRHRGTVRERESSLRFCDNCKVASSCLMSIEWGIYLSLYQKKYIYVYMILNIRGYDVVIKVWFLELYKRILECVLYKLEEWVLISIQLDFDYR